LTANIVLFIPYGIFLMMKGFKSSKSEYIYLPLVAIAVVECLQNITRRGSLDIDDLILNFIGVSLGYLLYPVFRRVIFISPLKKRKVQQ
jgi:glycopeptide antibiotics resistance protein